MAPSCTPYVSHPKPFNQLSMNNLHTCNQPVETHTQWVQVQPAKGPSGRPGKAARPCMRADHALPTSPAASRMCTTSVLPNKAASCKALPFSVWKANESAERVSSEQRPPSLAWPHTTNGTETETRRDRKIKNTMPSPLSLSFPFFLSGFQNPLTWPLGVAVPPAGHTRLTVEPPPQNATFLDGRVIRKTPGENTLSSEV